MEKNRNTPPTLRQIAKKAGLSVSTVSTALRGKPGVSKETIEKVSNLATSMGYRPNPLVSAWLRHVRSTKPIRQEALIAYVISAPSGLKRYFSSSVYQAYFKGAKDRAIEQGFSMECFNYDEFGSKRLSQILETRGVCGMVIGPLEDAHQEIMFPWEKFAPATIAYSFTKERIHRAANHHFQSVSLAVRKLVSYGYKSIALAISKDIDGRSSGMMSGAYWSTSLELGIRTIKPFTDFECENSYSDFEEWIKSEKPDALIGLDALYEWIIGLGLDIPNDISFVNLDWRPENAEHAGIDQHAERIGMTAVDLVVGQLYRNEKGIPLHPKSSFVESSWVDGPSAEPI